MNDVSSDVSSKIDMDGAELKLCKIRTHHKGRAEWSGVEWWKVPHPIEKEGQKLILLVNTEDDDVQGRRENSTATAPYQRTLAVFGPLI